jgi:hypothetical protein
MFMELAFDKRVRNLTHGSVLSKTNKIVYATQHLDITFLRQMHRLSYLKSKNFVDISNSFVKQSWRVDSVDVSWRN